MDVARIALILLAGTWFTPDARADGPLPSGECRLGEPIHFRAGSLESADGTSWRGSVGLSNHTGAAESVQIKLNITGEYRLVDSPPVKPGQHTIVPFEADFSKTSGYLEVNIVRAGRTVPGSLTFMRDGSVQIRC